MPLELVPEWMANLEAEDAAFIRRFVLASGSLKEVARQYGVTYPTVRLRLDRLIEKIELAERSAQEPYIALIRRLAVDERINELMRVSDKIVQDAIDDPSDVPDIRKFLDYYLPTTIKLLHAYDRMSGQGIEGENLSKSMDSIEEMLDTAVDAFKKQLDSLFEDQALDIETDISVMNRMLEREGLTGDDEQDTIIKAARGGQNQ